jgi:hypothetical protein
MRRVPSKSVFYVAAVAAVFSVFFFITVKAPAAVSADHCLRGSSGHFVSVAVPPHHAAGIGTEPLGFATRVLFHSFAALLTEACEVFRLCLCHRERMTAAVGFYSVDGQIQVCGDLCHADTALPHLINSFSFGGSQFDVLLSCFY